MKARFCTCTDSTCPLSPKNENCTTKSCDLCIKKCLKAGEIPACFFKAVHEDTSGQTDYSYIGFADYVAAHCE